ncbi:diguanylate cyclase [Methylomonas koyamae]|uniref:diguanylate cyclase n=1 Tax=Methylomonas koyamae TaxID=702114 RepID=A0A177N174_9GAMM|nr:GGDEF domain-containing protein [Methylomonas koyamae]OAI11293.1 diguanylate cyclase [Methylomonas koyamae]
MTTPPDSTLNAFSNTLTGNAIQTGRDSADLQPYLVVLSGRDQGKQFPLAANRHILGRELSADIPIADPKISRRHCLLAINGRQAHLEDLNSTNGTFVNDRRISRHPLQLLDRIRIGDTYLKVDYKLPSEAVSEQALYEAANIDSMTKVLNRNAFISRAQQEFSYCKRNRSRLTVMMCDADHFKLTNDNYGHLAGDQVLRDLAKILQAEMRHEDLLARYGGEEFIMLLREISAEAAVALAERIRLTVLKHTFRYQNSTIPSTLSIGLCTRRVDAPMTLDDIVRTADDALYRAKKNGRNRVEIGN